MAYKVMVLCLVCFAFGCSEPGDSPMQSSTNPSSTMEANMMAGMISQLVEGEASPSGLPDSTVDTVPDAGGRSAGSEKPIPTDAIAQIAVGHRFSPEIGVPGRGISIFTVDRTGKLGDNRIRLQTENPVTALNYAPHETTLLVASEDGYLTVFGNPLLGPDVAHTGKIDAFGIKTITAGDSGRLGIVSRDSSPSGGVYWFADLDDLATFQFLQLPLTQTIVQCPGRNDWVVVGGQTTFEPIRADDIHIVRVNETSAIVTKSGDMTDDVFDVHSVAVTADCRYALYGNRSPFTDTFGRLSLVDLMGETIQLADSIDTDEDISQVMYLSNLDLFLVSSFESETVSTYKVRDGRLTKLAALPKLGLIANFAAFADGDGAHLVIASVHASQGSRIGTAFVSADGQFDTPIWTSMGEGSENIPSLLSQSNWLSGVRN